MCVRRGFVGEPPRDRELRPAVKDGVRGGREREGVFEWDLWEVEILVEAIPFTSRAARYRGVNRAAPSNRARICHVIALSFNLRSAFPAQYFDLCQSLNFNTGLSFIMKCIYLDVGFPYFCYSMCLMSRSSMYPGRSCSKLAVRYKNVPRVNSYRTWSHPCRQSDSSISNSRFSPTFLGQPSNFLPCSATENGSSS